MCTISRGGLPGSLSRWWVLNLVISTPFSLRPSFCLALDLLPGPGSFLPKPFKRNKSMKELDNRFDVIVGNRDFLK